MSDFVIAFVIAWVIGIAILCTPGCHQPTWQCTGTRSDGSCNAGVKR